MSSARARGLLRICLHSDGGLGIDELELTAEESLLDCGAGDGGPAAQAVGVDAAAVERRGLPGGTEPVRLPSVQAVGSALAAG